MRFASGKRLTSKWAGLKAALIGTLLGGAFWFPFGARASTWWQQDRPGARVKEVLQQQEVVDDQRALAKVKYPRKRHRG